MKCIEIEVVAKYLREHQNYFFLGGYIFLGITLMLYPFGGLMADVCWGRYKVIISSILTISFGAFIMCSAVVMFASKKLRNAATVLSVFGYTISLLGFSGFRSNSVQFSLDQLLDAPSEKISLFLHWFVWTEHVGKMAISTVLSLIAFPVCALSTSKFVSFIACCVFFVTIIVCVLFMYLTHNLYHHEGTSSNPYKNVWKVLKFAAKHGQPLGLRSSFTYADDEKPSRLDLAKRIYGGPFETEVVEDVKTILRIVVMLLATTPVFLLEVPMSYLFPLFGLHLGDRASEGQSCTYKWILFESGSLSDIISVLAIPLYLCLVYPYIKKWLPPIIFWLGVGIALMMASITSMFVIQTLSNHYSLMNGLVNTTCLFLDKYPQQSNFPTYVLVISNLLYGIAAPLVSITVFEFISAQSPHTMKGLLLGVYYALRGLFVVLGSVSTLPFAQERLWGDQHGKFGCGFYYYLSNSAFSVLGLVAFILAARWYRYRTRDDPPYRHQYAEDYYSRYVSQPTHRLIDGHDLQDSYGTMDAS